MVSREPYTWTSGQYHPDSGSDALVRALRAAIEEGETAPYDLPLQKLVCERVRAMRDAGSPPETVIVRLKELTRNAVAPLIASNSDAVSAEALVAQVTQWCIAQYFRAD
jgi:hypothetical protein